MTSAMTSEAKKNHRGSKITSIRLEPRPQKLQKPYKPKPEGDSEIRVQVNMKINPLQTMTYFYDTSNEDLASNFINDTDISFQEAYFMSEQVRQMLREVAKLTESTASNTLEEMEQKLQMVEQERNQLENKYRELQMRYHGVQKEMEETST